MTDKQAISYIYSQLHKGCIFGNMFFGNMYGNCRSPYIHDNLYLVCGENGKTYIGWNDYGSSANSDTKEDLQWIISAIFKTTPIEFLEEYQCWTPTQHEKFYKITENIDNGYNYSVKY